MAGGAAARAAMSILPAEGVVLRPFRDDDAGLVLDAGQDALIPLITTVPSRGRGVISDRLVPGSSVSFSGSPSPTTLADKGRPDSDSGCSSSG